MAQTANAMKNNKTLSSDYFNKPWTWYKRLGYFLFFVLLVIAWESAEDPWDYWWIKYAILTFLSLGLFLSPVDDIAIDDNYFYHIKRSLLKSKNKVDKYDIATIKAVRCLGVHVPGLSLQEMTGTNRQLSTETNTLEITFKDGTYKSLELAIYKKELIFYAEKIRERMK
ncbi:MAG TPA: hypothetical protein PKM16_10325 [Bacteroidia bacterium]|nr:hypothetical protein [Bacteroidia bacterium]